MTLAEVTSIRAHGDYWRLVLAGDGLGGARPGQFLAVSVGGEDSPHVAARAFSVHDADPPASSASLVVAVVGAGTRWLADRRPGDRVRLTGPLGNAFTLPTAGRGWVGVGGGYGTAPLAWAAREAAAAGATVALVAGAATAARLCDTVGMREAVGERLWVTTDDGTQGRAGRVTTVLGEAVAATAAPGGEVTVAACGPMAMLAAVWHAAAADATRQVRVEVAVEEQMACGVGVCMTCVIAVVGDDGLTRMTRSCTAGPVLDASRVRWDALTPTGCLVPADTLGALA